MKKVKLLITMCLLINTLCNAQFPAPYFNHMYKGYCGYDWGGDPCEGYYVDCSPFFFFFHWDNPVLEQTESQLVGYNIYYYNTRDTDETNIVFEDAVIIDYFTNMGMYDNEHKMAIDLEGFVWITAVYSEPYGESEPSNLLATISSSYDFLVLNDDGIPIYYNFGKEGMSVIVTHKYNDIYIDNLSTKGVALI